MVSNGDLLGRRPRGDRHKWWVEMLASGIVPQDLSNATSYRLVREVMTAPLIAVGRQTSVPEIAGLLKLHKIKRVGVLEGGRLIGIVSRGDLLGFVQSLPEAPTAPSSGGGGLLGLLESLVGKVEPATPTLATLVPPHVAPGTSTRSLRGSLPRPRRTVQARCRRAASGSRSIGTPRAAATDQGSPGTACESRVLAATA